MSDRTKDRHPAIMKKDMVLCRSGVYYYTYDEMIARGHKPSVVKDRYSEYRPAEVILRNKDKFGLVTTSVEHTDEQTNPDNFHQPGQVSGAIGDNIRVETLADGNIALVAKVAFYTQDAVDYYNAGCRETSADYTSVVTKDASGKHDFIMTEIADVNNVVITKRGRGGEHVRVRDSLPPVKNLFGGSTVKIDMWKLIPGLKRTNDTAGDFKFSKVILDGVKTVQKVDRTKDSGAPYLAAVTAAVGKVTQFLDQLKDGDEKTVLSSIVQDSFGGDPDEVLANEAVLTEAIDKLYDSARAKDSDSFKKTLDSVLSAKEETEEEKAAKVKAAADDKKPVDIAQQVKDSVAEAMKSTLPALVAASVAQTLGLDPKAVAAARSKDAAPASVANAVKAQVEALLGGKSAEGGDDRTLDSDDQASVEEGSFILRNW